MAVISSTKDFWIHPEGLTLSINFFGDPQLIQSSLLAGAIVMAYRKDVIDYDAAHNFREWKLQAFPTQLSDTCVYYVHIELSRTGNTAMVIYSPVKRDMQGRSFVDGTWDDNISEDSWFIYIGTLSASVDDEGNTVERAWTDGIYTGTLATDQYRMEETSGDWAKMFSLNNVTGLIDVLKTISSVTINALTVAKNFVFGGKTLTGIAASEDSGEDDKINDATLPTTGYVEEEIKSLDDHFLIKDENISQSVAGSVTFESDVTVAGDHAVGGDQSVGGNQIISGGQELKGLQTLHEGFITDGFNDAAGQITGAHLTPDGKLYVSGLKANSFEIYELIFNVVKAQGGEFVYSTSCEIEQCIYVMSDETNFTPDEFYALESHDWRQIDHILITLREDEFTRYGNPFVEGDIIYGKVNQISESGKYAVGGECIMHITAVEENTLNITAELFQLSDGITSNIPPIEDMAIAHRGNVNGAKGRTTAFYLSTIDGNLVMLYNVTTPTLSAANYGASFGKLSYDLLVKVKDVYAGITDNDPVIYSKYGIFENIIQFDHLGIPIKTERPRGAWRYDVATSNDPYMETISYYDTVLHNGAKWRIRTTNTELEPSLDYGDWEMISDSGITVYALHPSSNIVYLRDGGVVSPESLDISVLETTLLGTEIIDDQATLVSKNLTVWYTIDGSNERTMLVLGGSNVFETEDGTSVLSSEANTDSEELPIYMEGESIDLSQVADNITLYLVENYPDAPADKASYVIPVVRDGAAPFGIEVTPSALPVPVDAETKATAGVRTFSSLVRLKQGKAYLEDVSEYSISLLFTFGEETSDYPSQEYHQLINYTIATDDNGVQYGWNILVESPDGVAIDKQLNRIDISINHSNAVVATEAIQVVYLERGITGPAGKDGPVLYPCGTWKLGAEYKFTYQLNEDGSIATDSDGKKIILAKPFVYYKNENNDEYYVLNDNVPADSDIQLSNTQYWKPFTKIQYIFTEALMANWAKLASAVFYSDYMFSMKGIDKDGSYRDFSAYQEGENPMFSNEGTEDVPEMRLNGNFVPNLFLDFNSGSAKFGKLSESFTRLGNAEILYNMDASSCHNLATFYREFYPCVITLPTSVSDDEYRWTEDGTHCSIVYDYWHQYTQGPSDESYINQVIAICADDRFLKPLDSKDNYGNILEGMKDEPDGWLIWKGRRCKFLLLAPGSKVALRSLRNEAGRIIWYIENSSDFEELNGKIQVYRQYSTDSEETELIGEIYNDTESMAGGWLGRLIGSPTLNWFANAPLWNFSPLGLDNGNDSIDAYMWNSNS